MNIDDINKLMSMYEGKSEEELMHELISAIDEQKRNGSFNVASFLDMCQLIDPMLTQAQREKQYRIVKALVIEEQ